MIKQIQKFFLALALFVSTASYTMTILLDAAANGRTEEVQRLITAKVDVNQESKDGPTADGTTALLAASFGGHVESVRVLLAAKALVNLVDENGVSPLTAAIFVQNNEILQMLLAAGAEVNRTDTYGSTALSYAAENGFAEASQMLIWAGANCDSPDYQGCTPRYFTEGYPEEEVDSHFLEVFKKAEKERAALLAVRQIIANTLSDNNENFFLQEKGLARYLTEYLVTPPEALDALTQ